MSMERGSISPILEYVGKSRCFLHLPLRVMVNLKRFVKRLDVGRGVGKRCVSIELGRVVGYGVGVF